MNKFVIGTAIALGIAGGFGWGTTAHAQTKWTAGMPQSLRGIWTQYRVQRKGHDTIVYWNELVATKKTVLIETEFGSQAYGGKRVGYRLSHGIYRLRDYDSSEKVWNYTKITRSGQKMTLQEYGRRHVGRPFKHVSGQVAHLTHNAKLNREALKSKS
ncbi:hypothetical protein [Levilactobacillus parabrevis]|uniref:hypothetical protein n=1 Tax=Levilactobacillus parabrevis TaxID=357278 RepID=UPI0021A7173A|nr:hypothetical protein [Levilactobacillus parabrevis]MCT4488728.1 hypothetical protein [Levilactobacillus parabrevis]MCT4489056.1 hypothetical protein [Levilactobacillus parabrevis]